MKQFVIESGVDFISEAHYIYVDEIGSGIEVIVPNAFHNGHAITDAAFASHQILQQPELSGGEIDDRIAARGLPQNCIQRQITHAQRADLVSPPRRRARVLGPLIPQWQKAWPGNRRRQHEAFHTFGHLSARGQEQNRAVDFSRPHCRNMLSRRGPAA